MILTNHKHLKLACVVLSLAVLSTNAVAHNADTLRKEREQLKCDSLINMNDSDVEQLGANAINRKKLCVAKQRLRESRERSVHTQSDQPLGQAIRPEDQTND